MKSVQLLSDAPAEVPVRKGPSHKNGAIRSAVSRCRWTCGEPSGRRRALDLLMLLMRMRLFRCRSCCKHFYRFSFQREMSKLNE